MGQGFSAIPAVGRNLNLNIFDTQVIDNRREVGAALTPRVLLLSLTHGMSIILRDDEAQIISARPRRNVTLSSKLTDTNNDATPELRSHRTATTTSAISTSGTKRSVLIIEDTSESDHGDDEGAGKKKAAPTSK